MQKEPVLKRILRLIPCLLLVLLAVGCRGERAVDAKPLIRVDERQISRVDFAAAFARTLKPGQEISAAEKRDLERAFLTELIDRELALAEARRRNLAVTPTELAAALDEHRRDYPEGGFDAMLRDRGLTLESWQAERHENLLIDKLADQVAGEQGKVGETEIDAYYAAHRVDFDRPPQVRARQILVADPATGERVAALLRKGEAFAEVARRESLAPEAVRGGDLGFFGRDEMPPEFEVVFTLPVGKVSQLVKSDYGYHLFLVEEKRPGARLSRQEAGREIRARLEAERRETVYQKWLQGVRSKARVEVDWQQLEAPPQESK